MRIMGDEDSPGGTKWAGDSRAGCHMMDTLYIHIGHAIDNSITTKEEITGGITTMSKNINANRNAVIHQPDAGNWLAISFDDHSWPPSFITHTTTVIQQKWSLPQRPLKVDGMVHHHLQMIITATSFAHGPP